MQKNLGRGSGPAVMQLGRGRGRVALYRAVLYCVLYRTVPYRGVPILFAVLAARGGQQLKFQGWPKFYTPVLR